MPQTQSVFSTNPSLFSSSLQQPAPTLSLTPQAQAANSLFAANGGGGGGSIFSAPAQPQYQGNMPSVFGGSTGSGAGGGGVGVGGTGGNPNSVFG
jgi:hypothetical protein